VALKDELQRIAAAAQVYADGDDEVEGVLAAELADGSRVYLCSFLGRGGRTWVALDDEGVAIESRERVRETVSIAALCEVAGENAGGGELERLRTELVRLRLTEHPPGIAEAEQAALELENVVGGAPRVASPAYLDRVGAASRRLEQALGEAPASPFAEALKSAAPAVGELTSEVERSYKRELR
jgi:hypothetical protein